MRALPFPGLPWLRELQRMKKNNKKNLVSDEEESSDLGFAHLFLGFLRRFCADCRYLELERSPDGPVLVSQLTIRVRGKCHGSFLWVLVEPTHTLSV